MGRCRPLMWVVDEAAFFNRNPSSRKQNVLRDTPEAFSHTERTFLVAVYSTNSRFATNILLTVDRTTVYMTSHLPWKGLSRSSC